jgi:hypothetical protein
VAQCCGVVFCFERSWTVPLERGALWDAVAETGRYDDWWPWLHDYRPARLVAGERAQATIAPPLPYRLRLGLEVSRAEPPARVEAVVSGDLTGVADLRFVPVPDGTEIRLQWEVELTRPGLRAIEPVARPVLRWGHDWIVDQAMRSFLVHHDLEPEPGSPASRRPAIAVGVGLVLLVTVLGTRRRRRGRRDRQG